MNERQKAIQFSQQLDRWLAGAAAPADLGPLAALPDLLPPPDATFERRVWAQVRAVEAERGLPVAIGRPHHRSLRLKWLVAPLAALLLFVLVALPGPRQALGNWMARFQVGDVQVVLVPEETVRPQLTAHGQAFGSLVEAETATSLALLEPSYLPAGYSLAGVQAVFYAELPPWLQPLYVEASYRPADASVAADSPTEFPAPGASYHLLLRQFNAERSGGIHVGAIELQSEAVRTAADIILPNGQPAILIEFDPPPLRQLVWQQDGLTLELWSQTLSSAEMLHIATSLR